VALCADQPDAWRRFIRLGLISIPLALIILGVVSLANDRLWLKLAGEFGLTLNEQGLFNHWRSLTGVCRPPQRCRRSLLHGY
jgi:hypothetical protein